MRSTARQGQLRKDLRNSSYDSFLSSAMIGAGETFLPAFALATGASVVTAGLLGALPILIGSCLQLAAPQLLKKVGCYRKCVTGLALFQAVSFLPFVYFAANGISIPLWSFMLMAAFYWACGLSGGAAWQCWMTKLVPLRVRSRYFAKRNHIGQVGLLFGLVAGGLLLEVAKRGGWELKAFAGLFLFSAISRLVSAYCIGRQRAQVVEVAVGPQLSLRAVFSKLCCGREGSIFLFFLVFAVAVNISGPFFNPYVLQRLKFSYTLYMWLTAIVFVAKILTFARLSQSARQLDPYRLMYYGLVGAALTPAFWLFSSNFLYMVVMQMVSGAAWATYELGVVLVLFQLVRDQERTRILSVFNFASSAMVLLGTAIGGLIFTKFGDSSKTYFLLFGLSAGARILCLVLFERAVVKVKGEIKYRATGLREYPRRAHSQMIVRGLSRERLQSSSTYLKVRGTLARSLGRT